MNLQSQREVDATCEKLQLLEQRYDTIRRKPPEDDHVQELTLRSLRGLINQLKEEIARFQGRTTGRAES